MFKTKSDIDLGQHQVQVYLVTEVKGLNVVLDCVVGLAGLAANKIRKNCVF